MPAAELLLRPHLPQAIDVRHRLHQIPELGYEEHKTAAAIRAELARLKIPFVEGPASRTPHSSVLGRAPPRS